MVMPMAPGLFGKTARIYVKTAQTPTSLTSMGKMFQYALGKASKVININLGKEKPPGTPFWQRKFPPASTQSNLPPAGGKKIANGDTEEKPRWTPGQAMMGWVLVLGLGYMFLMRR